MNSLVATAFVDELEKIARVPAYLQKIVRLMRADEGAAAELVKRLPESGRNQYFSHILGRSAGRLERMMPGAGHAQAHFGRALKRGELSTNTSLEKLYYDLTPKMLARGPLLKKP